MPGVTPELHDNGEVKLWRVKTYVRKGEILQKTFSISTYGRRAEGLAIAERLKHLQAIEGLSWVHPSERKIRSAAPSRKTLPALPEPRPANEVPRSINTSGFPGVVRRAHHWTAQTVKGSRWVSQSFRVDVLGEEVALILAVWARLDQLRARV